MVVVLQIVLEEGQVVLEVELVALMITQRDHFLMEAVEARVADLDHWRSQSLDCQERITLFMQRFLTLHSPVMVKLKVDIMLTLKENARCFIFVAVMVMEA